MTETPLTGRARPERTPHTLAEWRRLGGYEAVERALATEPARLVEEVREANLRGRGGAGFPTGKKWGFMPAPGEAPGEGPSYLCVNGDEMEPCTFKDRLLMEALPHQLVEGALIAAHAIGASEVVVLIRAAYAQAIATMRRAVAEAREAGFLGPDIRGTGIAIEMRVHESAGRYIVGEETALLEAVEGRRPVPRQKPPFPAQVGLWGRPTTVNNVETLSNLPHIVARGAAWYRGLSRSEDGGTKIYGVSGRVARPGLIEAPMGTPAADLLERAGGVAAGRALRAWQPGGGSSAFLEAAELGTPMDFDAIEAAGSWLGTGMMIVLDDRACPVGVIARHMRFYARESCGWCTPCREGLPWVSRLLEALEAGEGRAADLDILAMHVEMAHPSGRAFCALMSGGLDCLKSGLERFGPEFRAHLAGGCPLEAG